LSFVEVEVLRRVTTIFGELCDELGLPRIGIHGLRHSAATWLIGAGVNPKVVAQRLGHANVATTIGTYSHVLPGHDQARLTPTPRRSRVL
jgi:integrase